MTRELPVRWQVLGYEPVAGAGSVDRPRLARIVCIPRLFYRNFCTRATAEGDIPPDMAWFIEYFLRWMENTTPLPPATAVASGGSSEAEGG